MSTSEAAETKCIITGLLTSSSRKLTIKQLCEDFQDTVGYNIPFRQLGFNNVEDYLRSISDTIIVHGSGLLGEVEGVFKPKSAHISEMIAKQKKSTSRNKMKHPGKRQQSSSNGHSLLKSSSKYTQVSKFQSDFSRNNYPQLQLNSTPLSNRTNIKEHAVTQWLNFNYIDNVKSQENGSVIGRPVSESSCIANLNLRNQSPAKSKLNFSPSLNSYPEMLQNSLTESYNDCRKISGMEFVSCDDLELISTESNHKVPQKIQNNLKDLILQFPDGIWCTQLPIEYSKIFNKKLCCEKYNYRSLVEMCADLSEIFHYPQSISDDFVLYDKSKPIPYFNQHESSSQLPPKEHIVLTNILNEIPKLSWNAISGIVPSDVLHLGEIIPRYFIDDSLQEGDCLNINIGEIYDISKSWIYLEYGHLKPLMGDLQVFFQNNYNKYLIPEQLLEEGLYCSCLYAGKYHRSVIVNLLHKLEGFIRVLFIDYGTVENVSSNEILYLPKLFSVIPCQAIRARLSNIYPPFESRPWSIKAINRFKKLVTDAVLAAEIIQIDKEDNVLDIYLADISDEKNIFYINDVLVQEGFAIYADQKRKGTLTDPNCFLNVKYIHLYPEFYEIEAGSAPSTSDMNYIIINKLPMHHYIPQYFNIPCNENIDHVQECHEKSIKLIPTATIELDNIDDNFDISYFPADLVEEIRNIFDQEESSISTEYKFCTTKNQQSRTRDIEIEKESVTQYVCNKKRIAELKEGMIRAAVTKHCEDINKADEICYNNFDIVPLNNRLKKLNLNSSSSSVINNSIKYNKSTNPFLSDDSQNDVGVNVSPKSYFHSTNPFIDPVEGINANDFFEIFSKSSEEKLHEKIINNLNAVSTCTCKVNKQVNVEKVNITENPNLLNTYVKSSKNTNPFVHLEKKNEEMTTLPRVRTPPGFKSTDLRNIWNPNHANLQYYNNYMSNNFLNNPYYQQFPQFQWNNQLYLQNQFRFPMSQNNNTWTPSYYIPDFPPSQFQFNLQFLQQSMAAQNYKQQVSSVRPPFINSSIDSNHCEK